MQFLRPQYLFQPPAWFYPRILIGAGEMLTPAFCRRYSITHVINCAYPTACPEWFSKAFPSRYVCLDAIDALNVNILDWYPAFEESMSAFLRDPGAQTIFVHCQCGINRSAFLALTYVTTHYGLPYETSFKALKQQRPCMFTNRCVFGKRELFACGKMNLDCSMESDIEISKSRPS